MSTEEEIKIIKDKLLAFDAKEATLKLEQSKIILGLG